MAAFGRELGLAFQLKDDALDYDTSASVLGKTQYADLREGKVTLPLLLTLQRATNAERERIAAVLKAMGRHGDELSAQADLSDLVPVADLISRYHGITDTLRRADDHVKRAGEAIAVFPDSPAKQALLAAAAFAVTRDR